MKILVTGGAGYIGSFMVRRLLEDGYEVIVLDNLKRGHKEVLLPQVLFVEADIQNNSSINELFSNHQLDAIIHFAGFISMEESTHNPGLYFENNTFGTLFLLEAAIKHNVKNFIFSSTAGVYGNPITIPIPENHPKTPTNPYGESKLMVEQMLNWYNKVYKLNTASLRYFNAAGASLDGSMGENHNPETHIIPLAIKACLENKDFTLFGTDYDTPDGTCIRDYIHVLDLVEAHVLVLKKLQQDNGCLTYNVGTGIGFSNKEVIEMVKKITGINVNVINSNKRPGDADKLIADSSKIRGELGFNPRYSDLETIVKTAWTWHKK